MKVLLIAALLVCLVRCFCQIKIKAARKTDDPADFKKYKKELLQGYNYSTVTGLFFTLVGIAIQSPYGLYILCGIYGLFVFVYELEDIEKLIALIERSLDKRKKN